MSYSTHSLKFHTRVDSRVSLTSVGRMPVIAEDGSAIITQPSPPPAALLRPSAMNPQRSITSLPRGPPRPYIVGFMDIPAECKDEGNDDEDEETVVGEKMSKLRVRSGDGCWRRSDLQRRCHFVLVVAVVLVVLVGLAVGLALGLSEDGRS